MLNSTLFLIVVFYLFYHMVDNNPGILENIEFWLKKPRKT